MSTPPLPGIDAELKQYVEQLNSRIGHLEEDAKQLTKQFSEQEEHLDRMHGEFAAEVASTKADIQKIETQLMHIVKETGKLVNGFKNSARRTQLEKTEQRVDAWKGEQYLSKDEYKRMLQRDL
jgi:uncharacterized protein Yka (UPF0111/DUF47 family)